MPYPTTREIIDLRGRSHGDFNDQSRLSQNLKTVFFSDPAVVNKKFSYHQSEALDMILHKLARIGAGDANFRDHWVDIAGYAQLAADRCAEPPSPSRGREEEE